MNVEFPERARAVEYADMYARYRYSFARLRGLLYRELQDPEPRKGMIETIIDDSVRYLANGLRVEIEDLVRELDFVYPPLSGTSDRTTEAPEG